MLIWKIFVIIMSVASLTPVNVNSTDNSPPPVTPRRLRNIFVSSRSSNAPSHSRTPRSHRTSTESSANVDTFSNEPYISSHRSRQRGSSSANVNPPDNLFTSSINLQSNTPTSDQNLGSFLLFNEKKNSTHTLFYNTYNPFQPGSFGHKCYRESFTNAINEKQISVFCDTDTNNLESNNCIVRAIHFYKNDLMVLYTKNRRTRKETFLGVVHEFFDAFQLNPDNIPLPIGYCKSKAAEVLDAVAMERGPNYEVSFEEKQADGERYNSYVMWCNNILYQYQDYIPPLADLGPSDRILALDNARHKIAYHALNLTTTLHFTGQHEENIEAGYLYEISQNVTSRDANHKPSVYCQEMESNYNNIILSRELD